MPSVIVKERLKASAEEAWALICDVRNYPSRMPSVSAISVHSESIDHDGATVAIVDWEIELKGSILRWTERDVRDPRQFRIDYEQISGDMEKFEGWWQVFEVEPGLTDVELVVDFEIGIPLLKPMLEPVAARAIEQNSSEMLLALAPGAIQRGL
ncbi:MAG: type II toxin-antitoxin system RatA family toxin [Rhodoglobus sp.]